MLSAGTGGKIEGIRTAITLRPAVSLCRFSALRAAITTARPAAVVCHAEEKGPGKNTWYGYHGNRGFRADLYQYHYFWRPAAPLSDGCRYGGSDVSAELYFIWRRVHTAPERLQK